MAYMPAPLPGSDADAVVPYGPGNVRVYTGKVARAIFGPTYSPDSGFPVLSEDQLKDLVADTISKLIFFTNGLWPWNLQVDQRDSNGMPCEYSIVSAGNPTPVNVPTLPIQDETLIVTQAALDWFFFEFKDKKTSEEISDEGQKWSYTLSASVLASQYQGLRTDRDKALEIVIQRADYLTDYVSFIAERDALTSAMVEWWVRPGLTYPSGQEIFPSVAAFGG
jgi:hypothetical protein